MIEHEYEPIRGLPAELPDGEVLLWQGSPSALVLARRMLRLHWVAGYFVVLGVWSALTNRPGGLVDAALLAGRVIALSGMALLLLGLFAWMVQRTTVYTITSRRVVMRIGIALSVTFQIPFRMIDSAQMHRWADGAGDIALALPATERMSYLVMWPHVRPWRLARTQPSLRGLPDVMSVAQILGRALAAQAEQTVKTLQPVEQGAGADRPIPAAA